MAETPVVLVTSHLLKATDVSIIYGLDNLRTVLKFYKTLVSNGIPVYQLKIE